MFANHLDFPGTAGSTLDIDVQEREVLWRPADADLVALAINDSLKSWDGQSLATLRDDMALGGIARWLDRLADAAGIHSFGRFSGEPVEYQHYLI